MPVNMPLNYGSVGQFTRIFVFRRNPWSTEENCEKADSEP